MCLAVIRDAPKAILDAKKQKDMKKSAVVLAESAAVFAIASAVALFSGGADISLLLTSAVFTFVSIAIIALIFGLIIHAASMTLGGKGKYFEGLTTVSYAFVPISAGFLISTLLAFVPYAAGLQFIILALAFTLGLSILYRSVKELYSVDMVTALVAVSVAILALLMAFSASGGLSLLSGVASLPVV